MKETRYFYAPDAATKHELPQEEAVHALKVLRLAPGDELYLIDGKGTFYKAVVTLATQKKCLFEIQESLPQTPAWNGKIHLAIAPTKNNDRMEWLAEKATEIGFNELSFLHCRFSERTVIKTDRIDKIVVAATKQSRKAWKPAVNPITPFEKFIATPRNGAKYIAHCYDEIARTDLFTLLNDTAHTQDVTVLVGPEGDFSFDEVQAALAQGYQSVSLGNSRLRTETAGLMAVTMAQLQKSCAKP